MNTTANPPETASQSIGKRRWLSVFSLSAASFVDGGEDQSISILWPHMYRSLGLSIGQLGPVLGLSQFVKTITLPLWGYVADRFSRKSLLVGFTGFWGAWTLVISLVDTLPQLLIVRFLSSLGLGVFVPAAFSLVSDLFDDEERGRVAGIISAIGIIGVIAAFIILPGIAENGPEAWRNGFVLMGGASVLTGFLLLFIKEPVRGATEPEVGDVITADMAKRYAFQWRDLYALIKIRSWVWLLLLDVLASVGVNIILGWAFTWLDGMGLGESAPIIVGLMSLTSIGGAIIFGLLGDKLEKWYPNYGRITLVLMGNIALLPTVILFITTNPENITLLTLLGAVFGLGLSAVGNGLRWPLAQAVLLPELRASGRAVISMAEGISAALILTVSGTIADQVGITTMLLYIVPIPAFLSIIAWIPMFFTYSKDRDRLHTILSQRRQDLLHELD